MGISALSDSAVTAYAFDSFASNDTLGFTVHYDPSQAGNLDVEATTDAGATWMPLATLAPEPSGKSVLQWIPYLSAEADAHLAYFGIRGAFLRVTAADGAYADSPGFKLVGNRPFELTSPVGGESYAITDTLPVLYRANTNRISLIQVFFKTPSMPDWSEVTGREKLADDSPPIEDWVTHFVLLDYAGEANSYAQPVRILLADYGTSTGGVQTGDITITP